MSGDMHTCAWGEKGLGGGGLLTSKAAAAALSDVPLCGMISRSGMSGTGEK